MPQGLPVRRGRRARQRRGPAPRPASGRRHCGGGRSPSSRRSPWRRIRRPAGCRCSPAFWRASLSQASPVQALSAEPQARSPPDRPRPPRPPSGCCGTPSFYPRPAAASCAARPAAPPPAAPRTPPQTPPCSAAPRCPVPGRRPPRRRRSGSVRPSTAGAAGRCPAHRPCGTAAGGTAFPTATAPAGCRWCAGSRGGPDAAAGSPPRPAAPAPPENTRSPACPSAPWR